MIFWRSVDPLKLEPVFRQDVIELLTMTPVNWYVLYGYRSLAEQAALYDKYVKGGPKAAPPGLSPHNYGLAVDVVPDGDPDIPGLQPDWNTTSAAWSDLLAAIKAHPRLHSGASFRDTDHVERLGWQRFKTWDAPTQTLD